MRTVDVAHLELGRLARQAARAHRRDAPFVRQLGQGVDLVHELAQRAAAKEGLDRCGNRLDRDDRLRRRGRRVGLSHPLTGHALHAQEAGAQAVLQQLTDRAHALVLEVVDVVDTVLGLAAPRLGPGRPQLRVAQLDEVLDDRDQVELGQVPHVRVQLGAQLAVHLVAPDARQVVAPLLEEHVLQQALAAVLAGWVPRADDAVDRLEDRALDVGRSFARPLGDQVVAQRLLDRLVDGQHNHLFQLQIDDHLRDRGGDPVVGAGDRLGMARDQQIGEQALAGQLVDGQRRRVLDQAVQRAQAHLLGLQPVLALLVGYQDADLQPAAINAMLLGERLERLEQFTVDRLAHGRLMHLARARDDQRRGQRRRLLQGHGRAENLQQVGGRRAGQLGRQDANRRQVGALEEHLGDRRIHLLADLADDLAGLAGDHALGQHMPDDLLGLLGLDLARLLGPRLGLLEVVEGAQQRGHRELARLAQLDRDHARVAHVKLDPRTLGGDDLGRIERATRVVDIVAEVDTGRAAQLADDHPFGAVDDERATRGHDRQFAQVDLTLADLAGLLMDQHDPHAQRPLVGHLALAALLQTVLRFAEARVEELEAKAAGEVLDRREAAKQLAQAVGQEPLETLHLQLNQVGYRHMVRHPLPAIDMRPGIAAAGQTAQRRVQRR